MADLTSRQPLTDGTNRIIDDPATPSAIPGILSWATGTMEAFGNLAEERATRKANKKKEAEKARKLETQAGVMGAVYGAQDDVARNAGRQAVIDDGAKAAADLEAAGELDTPFAQMTMQTLNTTTSAVFEETVTLPEDIIKKVRLAGDEITRVAAAVEQGRMPPISLKTALNTRVRALFDKYPDQAENILDMLGKVPGAKEIVGSELQDVVFDIETERNLRRDKATAEQNYRQEMIKAARTGLGEAALIAGPNGGPMTDEELFVHGIRFTNQQFLLTQAERKADMALKTANLTAAERKEAEETGGQEIVRIISGEIHNDAAPFVQMGQQIAAGLGSDTTGTFTQRFAQLGPLVNSKVQSYVENAVSIAQQKGYKGDLGTLRRDLTAKFQPLMDLFSGDKSVFQANHLALKTMQDKLALNVGQALPVFSALKAAGLPVGDMPGLIEGISRNPDLNKKLMDEVKGFVPEFGDDRASTRLMNIVRILRGETTLAQMSPAAAREGIKVLHSTSVESAKGYIRGLGVSPDTLLNSVGQVTLATRVLSPSSGVGANAFAAAGIGDPNVIRALIKLSGDPAADKAMVTSTISATRAGHANLLQNFRNQKDALNRGKGQYFQIVWDNNSGEYRIDNSKYKAAIATARRFATQGPGQGDKFSRMGGALAESNIANAQVPQEISNFVRGANLSLAAITDLAPHDPTSPKATPLEMRRFYGAGVPTKSMRDDSGQVISSSKELGTMFDKFEKGLEGIKPDVVDVAPAKGTGVGDYASNPDYQRLAPSVQSAAQKHGVPTEILASLINRETGFRSRPGPVITSGSHKGDRAMGLGQVMAKTAAKYLRQFGVTDRSQLNEEQQLELAAMVLADNKRAGGNWKDAISRYFTGVDYARAKKEGRSDGYADVFSYVESIVG